MSGALDRILDHMQRIERRGAGVLLFGTGKWCGPTPGVLLVHEVKTDTWNLPESIEDVAPEGMYLDPPADIAGYQVVRCVQFAPPAGEKYDDFVWSHPEYAVSCSNHPKATEAIQQFLAGSGNSTGGSSMESRLSPREAQQKAQRVYEAFGDAEGAPAILNGESGIDHRIRLLSKYQSYSKRFKDANLAKIGDETAFTAIEDSIYADALQEAEHPTKYKPGVLEYITRADGAGRPITKAAPWSDPGACWNQFNPPVKCVRINSPGSVH